MSVQLDPSNQLGFNRPLTVVVKRTLNVRNDNSQPVAFKVKTTAPKLYCVRPNSGRIEPGQSVEVSVLLQPMREDPPASTKCKDKFLVQSTFITPEREHVSLTDIWNMAGGGDGVHQQKVKVVYLPPEGEILPEMDESMEKSVDNSRFTMDSSRFEDQSMYGTVRGAVNGHPHVLDAFVPVHRTPSPSHHNERSPSPAQGDYIIAHEDSTQYETHYGEPPAPTPGVVNINVHSARSQEDPNASKYAEAQDEISRLKALVASLASSKQAEESGLRRRTKAYTDDGSYIADSIADDETVVDRSSSVSTESGVPLQVVIIIALGVFVTTYLFF
ncbi:phosphatidylinositol-binding protein scs2 [Tulasnella sp. JGI-2019a]|nr:phosphatidylinositol-binding protein scs2 [Tulasnella sp. JGI-2019a]KAG9001845.1 phosphatidylinositol-binding protein scs2 [Tulasnella sp. JGI-2019a]KAG9037049.1 phosphatidylinositol-binding protein scs2 [Tulasnella sp. JGI-2019a]